MSSSPPNDERDGQSDLTPIRAHYLKKSLVQLQFSRELDLITTAGPSNVSTLSYLGPPFTPPPKDTPPVDLPFLRYVFRQFVLTFPFMAAAPKDFYSQKLQPFVSAVLARGISPTSVLDEGDSEEATRKKLLAKLERNLSLFINAATKLVEPEEVVRLTQADLDRLEALTKKRQKRLLKERDLFEVNIVGVRTVVEKGRMRSRAHEVRLDGFAPRPADVRICRNLSSGLDDLGIRMSMSPDVMVIFALWLLRRLTKAHPKEDIPSPPAKDRTFVMAPSTSPMTSPLSRQFTTSTLGDSDSGSPTYASDNTTSSRLSREKNRLTLRSYLHSLLASSAIASSPVLRSFLLSGPIVLSPEELEDAKLREEADRVRDEGRKRFAKEIASRVDGLRDAVKSVKGDIMGKDGLTHVFATIKVTPDIQNLPSNYQAVIEWARISLASTVFHMFVASDDASETFAGLKRIHGLMPYFMMKAALKITNPVSMIRNVLDLFLAQPFGGRSLLQRMFTSSLTEEVKALEEQIEAVKEKVDDPIMCEKIKQFVYAPREIQAMLKEDAIAEQMNVVTIVLRSAENPVLSRAQMHRLARSHKAHVAYMKQKEELECSDDDDGPQDEDAWLLEDLRVLTHLYSRLKDREQLIELIFEGFTSDLLKDIITIFYAPLAQVYRAASIGDSLSDLQNFVNDLIKTVEQVEELSQDDPHKTVQDFISLIQRHEQSFYHFVHKVHSKGESLFDGLMHWIELFLTVIREGLGDPISLEFLLPHTGQERIDILSEVDQVAQYHYKLKVLYEDKLRKRFGRAQSGSDADAEDEATQALVNGVVNEINFGDLVRGDAMDLAAEETDEETTSEEGDYSSSDYESGSEEDSEESQDGFSKNRKPDFRGPLPQSPLSPSHPTHSSSNSNERASRAHQHFSSSAFRYRAPSSSRTIVQDQATQPVPKRKRSLSLHRSKSMNFSLSTLSLNSRRSQDVPPVPPLPVKSKTTIPSQSKPLPPSPPQDLESAESPPPVPPKELSHRSSQQQDSRFRPSVKPVSKKKTADKALKPPDLVHIPKLLPVFVEMMRPLLRVRKVSGP